MKKFNKLSLKSSSIKVKNIHPKKEYKVISKFTLPVNKVIDPKYKTELCKKFEETGKCPYGSKCRFAHGKEELNIRHRDNNYKQKDCKSFNELGFCPYGERCNFRHDEKKIEEIQIPFHFISLFILEKVDHFQKRLPIFEEICQQKKFNEECKLIVEKADKNVTLIETALHLFNCYILDMYPETIYSEPVEALSSAFIIIAKRYIKEDISSLDEDYIKLADKIQKILEATPLLSL